MIALITTASNLANLGKEVLMAENLNLTDIVTPIKVRDLKDLLVLTHYDELKSKTLVDGFTHGFNLQYQGPRDRQRFAPNLKLRIGDEVDL